MLFTKEIITEKNKLLIYKEQIFNLFFRSFNRTMDHKLWYWAYFENPNGNPIVTLYFFENELIGHYAFIPVGLKNKQNKVKSLLSMTTMIDSRYRKYGIFQTMAEETNTKAIELGYQLVYGFPNKLAAPGLKKRLKWILFEDLYVAKLTYTELQQIIIKENNNMVSFDTLDKENLLWRLRKPEQSYIENDKNILKKFDNCFDIVYRGVDFSNLEKDKEYNLLIDLDSEQGKYLNTKQFDYIFGYRLFDSSLEGIEFKKDLIMSDVF